MWRLLLFISLFTPLFPLWAQDFGETIVVSATLKPVKEAETGAAVERVNREDIERSKAVTLGDLLRYFSGMTLLTSGTPGKVTSLFTRGTESDHTLILYDGVPLNSPFFAGFDLSTLPTEGLDGVEIARGPFSALYGSDAVGGIVQLFTRPDPGWSATASAGDDSFRHGGFHYSTANLFVQASSHHEEGASENDGFDQDQALVHFDGKKIGFIYLYGDQESQIPFSMGVETPRRLTRSRRNLFAVPLHLTFGERTAWETRIGYVETDLTFHDPDDPYGYTWGKTRTDRLFVKSYLSHTMNGWQVIGGVEGRWDGVDDASTYGVNLDNETIDNTALFVLASRTTGAFTFNGGVRWDHHSDFGDTVNPRTSLTYSKGNHTVEISYGTSFRAPGIGELTFPYSGNPDLDPEKGRSWEAGYRFTGRSWAVQAHLFDTRLSNLIDFDYATYTFQNTGKSHLRGLDGTFKIRIGKVQASLSGTYLEDENVETRRPLLRRPHLSASLFITLPVKTVLLTLAGNGVGRRWDIDPVTFNRKVNDAYTRWDLIAEIPMGHLTPFIKIENLGNSAYEEILGYPALGRRIIVGLNVSGRGPRH